MKMFTDSHATKETPTDNHANKEMPADYPASMEMAGDNTARKEGPTDSVASNKMSIDSAVSREPAEVALPIGRIGVPDVNIVTEVMVEAAKDDTKPGGKKEDAESVLEAVPEAAKRLVVVELVPEVGRLGKVDIAETAVIDENPAPGDQVEGQNLAAATAEEKSAAKEPATVEKTAAIVDAAVEETVYQLDDMLREVLHSTETAREPAPRTKETTKEDKNETTRSVIPELGDAGRKDPPVMILPSVAPTGTGGSSQHISSQEPLIEIVSF
jgi:hypothetical protein